MEKGLRYLQILALIISITAPSILIAGYAFWIGYITPFGLSPELIPKTLSDMLLESWILVVHLLAYFAPKIFYVLGALLLFWLFLIVVVHLFQLGIKKGVIDLNQPEITQDNQGKMYLGLTQWMWKCLFQTANELGSYFLGFCIPIVVAGIFLLYPYQLGISEGNKFLEKYSQQGCSEKVKCYQLIDHSTNDNQTLGKGVLITSNREKVALYDGSAAVYTIKDTYQLQVTYESDLSED